MNMMQRPEKHDPEKDAPEKDAAEKRARPVVVDDDDAELQGPDYADIFSKPPTVALSCLVMGMVIQLFITLKLPGGWPWMVVGGVLVLAGLRIAMAAMNEFKSHETTVPTDEPASALVTSGVFQRSRNPIYIGLSLLYLGIALAMANVWALALFVPLFVYLNNHVIPQEEDYLTRKFGSAYKDYMGRVGRWF